MQAQLHPMVEHPSSPSPPHGPSRSPHKTYHREAPKPPPCGLRHSVLSPCSAAGHASSDAASPSSPAPAQSHSPQRSPPRSAPPDRSQYLSPRSSAYSSPGPSSAHESPSPPHRMPASRDRPEQPSSHFNTTNSGAPTTA